jgi:REP element-mobilizing transposase RayT
MFGRANEPTLPDPLAYFITWCTYGTWLPGDSRGWVEFHQGWHLPDAIKELESRAKMAEDACLLTQPQRLAVQAQIEETCQHRGWELHAVNCRSNHAHILLTANANPKVVRAQLKAWCTRKLKSISAAERQNWWAERGSVRWIFDALSLDAARVYIVDGQDHRVGVRSLSDPRSRFGLR